MPYSKSLCSEEERLLIHRARQAEQAARRLLERLPPAQPALRREAEHKTEMERLQAAVVACAEAGCASPEVKGLLFTADRHYWRLALSATYCLRLEARRLSSGPLGREDLMQDGYLGLLEAARRFDPDRQLRFSTYARWWVRSQMQRALEHGGRLVRMPGSAAEDLRHLSEERRDRQAQGAPAGVAGLAQAVGISGGRARFLLQQGPCVSLDEPSEEGVAVQERLAEEPPEGDCEDQLIRREDLARLDETFQRVLDERERTILTRHYGLDGLPASSLAVIGAALSLSRERIRQLEVLSLQHLRLVL